MSYTDKMYNFSNAAKYYHPNLTIQGLQALLIINKSPGITMPDLAVFLDINPSTVSRNIKILSTYIDENGQKAGYDLVETKPDLTNRKRLGCHLSEKGKGLIERLNQAFDFEPQQKKLNGNRACSPEKAGVLESLINKIEGMTDAKQIYNFQKAALLMDCSIKIINTDLNIITVSADPGVKFKLQGNRDHCAIRGCKTCITGCLGKQILNSKKAGYTIHEEMGWVEFGYPVKIDGNIQKIIIIIFPSESPFPSVIQGFFS